MKTLLLALGLLALTPALTAASVSAPSTTTRSISVPGSAYDLSIDFSWTSDDYPINSAPGRVELFDSGGSLVARMVASVYRSGGPSVSLSGSGSYDISSWYANVYTPSGVPADAGLFVVWHVTGLSPGSYTVKLWNYTTYDTILHASTVWTSTGFAGGAPAGPTNNPPTITWTSAPGTAENGQGYYVGAHGHDDDANLVQVNLWKNGVPFSFAGGGNGTEGDSGNWTSDGGPQTVTFTAQAVDATGATSPVITYTITINAVVNQPPTVTLLAPGAQTITAGTALAITSRATDPDGNISSHNLDIQRPAGDWNYQGSFAAGEPFQGGPVGSGGDSTRSTSFTFSDVGIYYVRSAASDGSGWYHSATVAITVLPPPPVQYALTTSAGPGGTVSPGGTYTAGTTVVITAAPDAAHDFAGWSGDGSGAANPLAVPMDRAKFVQATFAPKSFTLVTNAASGGSVTPGGSYPYGTTVTIAAAPDATHRFVGWSGDAGGVISSIALTIDRPLAVQALFEPKTAQTISFPPIGDQSVGTSFPLVVTSSSGLPVALTVTGPATYAGGVLTLTGPGAVSVQATQGGDGYYLPAAPVTRLFNAAAAAVVRYRANARTLLQTGRTPESVPYVIQPNP